MLNNKLYVVKLYLLYDSSFHVYLIQVYNFILLYFSIQLTIRYKKIDFFATFREYHGVYNVSY